MRILIENNDNDCFILDYLINIIYCKLKQNLFSHFNEKY